MTTRDPITLLDRPPWRGALWPGGPARARLGAHVRLLLLDLDFPVDLSSILGAPVTLRRFGSASGDAALRAHAAAIACTLVGEHAPSPGLARGATLYGAAIGGADGCASAAAVAAALTWAQQVGPHVIVMPFGDDRHDAAIADAIDRLDRMRPRPILIASAGNGHPRPTLFPARHPACVRVAAGHDDGSLLDDAARDPSPDVIAPGWNVRARVSLHQHAHLSGSSIAAAIVAAAIARRISAPTLCTRDQP